MNEWFYTDDGNADLLRSEIKLWNGTRFWRGAKGKALRGVYADCISYVATHHRNTGALRSPVEWPEYVTHTGGRSMETLLIESVENVPEIAQIWRHGDESDPFKLLMFGDIIMTSTGKNLIHAATFVGQNTITHCWQGYGVCEANMHDTAVRKFMKRIWRIKSNGNH